MYEFVCIQLNFYVDYDYYNRRIPLSRFGLLSGCSAVLVQKTVGSAGTKTHRDIRLLSASSRFRAVLRGAETVPTVPSD